MSSHSHKHAWGALLFVKANMGIIVSGDEEFMNGSKIPSDYLRMKLPQVNVVGAMENRLTRSSHGLQLLSHFSESTQCFVQNFKEYACQDHFVSKFGSSPDLDSSLFTHIAKSAREALEMAERIMQFSN